MASDDDTGGGGPQIIDAVIEEDKRRSSEFESTVSTERRRAGAGRWEEVHGNYLLRPASSTEQPRALIHFLGGALVGAAPDVCYRYLLERLADRNLIVVATPFDLKFDHLASCDEIITRFERIAPDLAQQYGAVPVVGVGHSCGALLQLLITSLFPDTPRAANALLSFNNKDVKEAVPFFEEIVTPLFTTIAGKGNATGLGMDFGNGMLMPNVSGTEAMSVALKLARTASKGDLPSDKLLTEVARIIAPPSMSPEEVNLPSNVREALMTLIEPSTLALDSAGLLSAFGQVLDVADQIPSLIDEVAEGARDFHPKPSSVRAAARRAYRARRTLIIQYDNDGIDESPEIEEYLREAENLMRIKRPMVNMDIQRKVLKGGHASPLLAPPLEVAGKVEDVLGKDLAKDRLFYSEADATVEEILRWLDEGQL